VDEVETVRGPYALASPAGCMPESTMLCDFPVAPAPSAMIELRDVEKAYRFGESDVRALRGLSLTVPKGAFVALMGMKGVGEELEGVMKSAKHPVGNFGRLSEFAGRQLRDIVIGNDLDGLHPKLAAEGQVLARLTKRLARGVIRMLGKHREKILDMELVHERLAGAAIELYAMAAVISKLQSMLEHVSSNGNGNGSGNGNGHAHGDFARDLTIGRSFCAHAAERIDQRLRALSSNEDKALLRTADAVLALPPSQ